MEGDASEVLSTRNNFLAHPIPANSNGSESRNLTCLETGLNRRRRHHFPGK